MPALAAPDAAPYLYRHAHDDRPARRCSRVRADKVHGSVAGLLGLKSLRRQTPHERAARCLYAAAVAAARNPWFYQELGVPDTLDGRFDLVALHVFLLVHRLQDEGEQGLALAQAVFDAMFSDMDGNLREIGVSDLSVGRRMRAMWEAFHGRSKAYATALRTTDRESLEAALARNVWRGTVPSGAAGMLARLVLARSACLGDHPLVQLAAGEVRFQPIEEALG